MTTMFQLQIRTKSIRVVYVALIKELTINQAIIALLNHFTLLIYTNTFIDEGFTCHVETNISEFLSTTIFKQRLAEDQFLYGFFTFSDSRFYSNNQDDLLRNARCTEPISFNSFMNNPVTNYLKKLHNQPIEFQREYIG